MKTKKNSDRKPLSAKELKAQEAKLKAALDQQMSYAPEDMPEWDRKEMEKAAKRGGASIIQEPKRKFVCNNAKICGPTTCHHSRPHEWSSTDGCTNESWCATLVNKLNPAFNEEGRGMATSGEYGIEGVRLMKAGLCKMPKCEEAK